MDTPYTRLGLAENASVEEIRKAPRKFAKDHPDLHGGSKEKEALFKRITEDVGLLLDPAKRAALDAHLAHERRVDEEAARAAAMPARAERAKPAPAADPVSELWRATPLEDLARSAMASQAAGNPFAASIALGVAKAADLAMKIKVAGDVVAARAPVPPPSRRPAVERGQVTCKAIKRDRTRCPYTPLPSNYGYCGVHRR